MRTIKQTIFKIELSHPNQWSDMFFVEANTFEEALAIAKEVIIKYYKDWSIKSINSHAPLFKSLTKTITIEV